MICVEDFESFDLSACLKRVSSGRMRDSYCAVYADSGYRILNLCAVLVLHYVIQQCGH